MPEEEKKEETPKVADAPVFVPAPTPGPSAELIAAAQAPGKNKKKLILVGVPYVPDGDYYTLEKEHPEVIEWVKLHAPDVYEGIQKKISDHQNPAEPTKEENEVAALQKKVKEANDAMAEARVKSEEAERKRLLEEKKATLEAQIAGAEAQTASIKAAAELGVNA